MSDMTTIARPYAKAVYKHALAEKKLASWSIVLCDLAQAVLDKNAERFINNPTRSVESQCQLLLSVLSSAGFKETQESVSNLLHLLAKNRRLMLLPDIFVQFEALRAEQEKTLTVHVRSFSPLSDAQKQHLIRSLGQRLQREISLDVSVDQALLGGAIIRAGDLVIDGSIRGKLNKLRSDLAA